MAPGEVAGPIEAEAAARLPGAEVEVADSGNKMLDAALQLGRSDQ